MSAEIFAFPGSAEPAAEPAGIVLPLPVARPRREYDFEDMCALLSLTAYRDRETQIAYLRDLADQAQLPLPKNPRKWKGRLQRGPAMIGALSRWCALEVDAWIDGRRTPPAGGAALHHPDPLPPEAPLRAALRGNARAIAAGTRS